MVSLVIVMLCILPDCTLTPVTALHSFSPSFLPPQVPPAWRSVRVQAKGHGLAVLQLSSSYHVTDQGELASPNTKTFRLSSQALWHGTDAPSQRLSITSCVSWAFRDAAETSGVAVLEVLIDFNM